jgi:hypothetical protein
MIPLQAEPNVTYDVIEVEGNIFMAIEWCTKTFGDSGERWFISNDRFYFKQEKDAMLFELRF